MPDLKLREWAAMVPLIVMMVWMGVYSQSFLPPVSKATARVLDQTAGQRAVPRGIRRAARSRWRSHDAR